MRSAESSQPVFLLVFLVVGTAKAQQRPNVLLEVERASDASSCVDAARLTRSVEKRLKRKAFDEQREPELKVQVSFERVGSRWTSRVRLSDGVGALGRREISTEAPHCSSIDDSLALVVALLVDTPPLRAEPLAVAESQDVDSPPSDSSAPLVSELASTPIELPADTLAPRESFRFDVRACGAFGIGLVGGLSPGVELAVGAKPPRGPWLRLVGDFFLPTEHSLAPEPAGVRLSAGRIGVEVCGLSAHIALVETEVCAGQKVGALQATGFGFERNLDSSRLYYALTLGGNAIAVLSRSLGAVVGLHAEIPFTRDRFTARVEDSVEVSLFRAPVVAAVARVGLRVEL